MARAHRRGIVRESRFGGGDEAGFAAVDPIARCADALRKAGVKDDALESVEREAEAKVARAVYGAIGAPWPSLETLFVDVQDSGAPR